MKNFRIRAQELLDRHLGAHLKYAAGLSRRLGFSSVSLDESDAVSLAALKFWQLAQTLGDKPDDEFCKIAKTSIKNALKTLLRDTRRHDPRYNGSSDETVSGFYKENPGEDVENTEEDDTDEKKEIEKNIVGDDLDMGDDSGDGDDPFCKDFGSFKIFSERLVDSAFVGDGADISRFNFEDRGFRLRTARTIHAIWNENTPANFNRWLSVERRARVKEKDLLSRGEQFVLRTYGAGMKAVEALKKPEAKELGFRTVNDITNTFLRAYKRVWVILEKLGYHWIDINGAFRGSSLDSGEWGLAFLSAEVRKWYPRAFCIAINDLYNSVEIEPQ